MSISARPSTGGVGGTYTLSSTTTADEDEGAVFSRAVKSADRKGESIKNWSPANKTAKKAKKRHKGRNLFTHASRGAIDCKSPQKKKEST